MWKQLETSPSAAFLNYHMEICPARTWFACNVNCVNFLSFPSTFSHLETTIWLFSSLLMFWGESSCASTAGGLEMKNIKNNVARIKVFILRLFFEWDFLEEWNVLEGNIKDERIFVHFTTYTHADDLKKSSLQTLETFKLKALSAHLYKCNTLRQR